MTAGSKPKKIIGMMPSVNFHLWKPCNMKCKFCFATFHDITLQVLPKGHMAKEECLSVVRLLAEAGFQKINFAGGEPTLCPWLPDLIRKAKELSLTTSIVTNGSRLTEEWINQLKGSLDWVALSIDTIDQMKLERMGRKTSTGPLTESQYLQIIASLRCRGIRLKVNTVVTSENFEEDFTPFITQARPERWKVLQVLPVSGQNDDHVDRYTVSKEQFDRYVDRHKGVEREGIVVVPESNDLIIGSYVMIDPAGRFFDNVKGTHTYSRPIVEVGVEKALEDVSMDLRRFLARGGLYAWSGSRTPRSGSLTHPVHTTPHSGA